MSGTTYGCSDSHRRATRVARERLAEQRAEELAARIQADHQLADLARSYCAAMHANKSAEPCDWERARAEVDRCYYELMVACGYFEVDE